MCRGRRGGNEMVNWMARKRGRISTTGSAEKWLPVGDVKLGGNTWGIGAINWNTDVESGWWIGKRISVIKAMAVKVDFKWTSWPISNQARVDNCMPDGSPRRLGSYVAAGWYAGSRFLRCGGQRSSPWTRVPVYGWWRTAFKSVVVGNGSPFWGGMRMRQRQECKEDEPLISRLLAPLRAVIFNFEWV